MKTNSSFGNIVTLVFKGVGLAMAIATVVLNILGAAPLETQVLMLGISLACLAIVVLDGNQANES